MSALLIVILQIASLALIARALLSWFNAKPESAMAQVKQSLISVTEPVLSPIRRLLPRVGGLDLSVVVALLAINFLFIPVASVL